jgi:hypothetical protein
VDADPGLAGLVQYTLTNPAFFDVHPQTGVVRVGRPLFELVQEMVENLIKIKSKLIKFRIHEINK